MQACASLRVWQHTERRRQKARRRWRMAFGVVAMLRAAHMRAALRVYVPGCIGQVEKQLCQTRTQIWYVPPTLNMACCRLPRGTGGRDGAGANMPLNAPRVEHGPADELSDGLCMLACVSPSLPCAPTMPLLPWNRHMIASCPLGHSLPNLGLLQCVCHAFPNTAGRDGDALSAAGAGHGPRLFAR